MKQTATDYNTVCEDLGFDPTTKFVVIEDGKISFSIGKPDELRKLFQAVKQSKYEMADKLINMERRLYPHRF